MKVKSSTLAFCVCSYSACVRQRRRHGQEGGGGGGGEGGGEKEEESSFVKWGGARKGR